jgi:hypothetical protein
MYIWGYPIYGISCVFLHKASKQFIIIIAKYNIMNITVASRNPPVCTRAPPIVGPTKFPREKAESQIPAIINVLFVFQTITSSETHSIISYCIL